jgi:prephenate dehydratase
LDFLGSTSESRVKNALNHLREITETLEVLGCYPRDKSVEKKGM